MNKFTFKTIRAGFVLSFGLFMAVSTVFASATILSVQTTDITDTTATLNSQYDNPGMNSYVHFEWGYGSSFPSNVAGTQSFSTGSSFKTTLEGLNPNTTYSYRAVVVARPATGGAAQAPVYSQIVSFTTAPLKGTAPSTTSPLATTYGSNNTTQNNSNNTSPSNTTKTKTASVATAKKADTTQAPVDTKEGFTNDNGAGASVIGSGVSIFPTTLIGWIILLIAILILLLIVRMIYEQSEKRKKALAAKKAAEAALAEAKKNQTTTA